MKKNFLKHTAPLTGRFLEAISRWQKKAASYLNSKTVHWSQYRQKIVLVAFCIVTGAGSVLLVIKGIIGGTGPPPIHHAAATRPALLNDSINNQSLKFHHNDNDK
ncbi:MAG: hypothetical protein JST19_06645 [Bacteroidetes bacterium]|nr:hypothetical protein [Bacteroidota bacterium]